MKRRLAPVVSVVLAALSGPALAQSLPDFRDERRLPAAARPTASALDTKNPADDARRLTETEAKTKADQEARRLAEAEAKKKADNEARLLADAEAKKKADNEARRLAEAEAKKKTDEEARRLAEVEAKKNADAEARRLAEVEAKKNADAEARRLAEAEAKKNADAEARRLAEAEAKKNADAEARRLAEAEAKKNLDTALAATSANEIRRLAEAAARRTVEEEARTTRFLARGRQLFEAGDVVAARTFLQRAADANSPEAAFELGRTFDPFVLTASVTHSGITGDVKLAREWYQRASALGLTGLAETLQRLSDR